MTNRVRPDKTPEIRSKPPPLPFLARRSAGYAPAMNSTELLAAACPKIGGLGGAFYFAPETVARGKELGLDGFRFYVLGRGGVLGDVESPVIASAFGYWNGDLIAKMWNTAREKMGARDGGRHYMACAQDFGRAKFSGVANLGAYCEAAQAVVAAANPAGLALFAGVAGEPLADDLPAKAMQLATVLREFRGSAHLVAVLASGIEPRIAHFIRRPEMNKMFGWGEDEPTVPAEAAAQLAAADALTDKLVLPAYSVLDESAAAALVSGLDAMEAALAG